MVRAERGGRLVADNDRVILGVGYLAVTLKILDIKKVYNCAPFINWEMRRRGQCSFSCDPA